MHVQHAACSGASSSNGCLEAPSWQDHRSDNASGCRASGVAIPLRRLPVPRPGQVLGLVGTNGIGKSTALKILAGKLKPNLGRLDVSNALAAHHQTGCSAVLAVHVLPVHMPHLERGCKVCKELTFSIERGSPSFSLACRRANQTGRRS